jgi:hypothetical protein
VTSALVASAPEEVEAEVQVWDSASQRVLGGVVQWELSRQDHSQRPAEEQKRWGAKAAQWSSCAHVGGASTQALATQDWPLAQSEEKRQGTQARVWVSQTWPEAVQSWVQEGGGEVSSSHAVRIKRHGRRHVRRERRGLKGVLLGQGVGWGCSGRASR